MNQITFLKQKAPHAPSRQKLEEKMYIQGQIAPKSSVNPTASKVHSILEPFLNLQERSWAFFLGNVGTLQVGNNVENITNIAHSLFIEKAAQDWNCRLWDDFFHNDQDPVFKTVVWSSPRQWADVFLIRAIHILSNTKKSGPRQTAPYTSM